MLPLPPTNDTDPLAALLKPPAPNENAPLTALL